MNETCLISREIGIDSGHRVPHHGSKCSNLHGHRYRIEAWCRGELATAGEQQGMVLDFGFLKELMLQEIDAPCDHGMLLWRGDEYLPLLQTTATKLYVCDFVPTAEHLARHWFERLEARVVERSNGRARLVFVKVWETPNCWAGFGPEPAC